MQAVRKIYEHIADKISIPEELRHRRVEVIMLPLEEPNKKWPDKFFEMTAGCLVDDPIERAPQSEYEAREPLK
jgi:hypothetical protein